MMISGRVVVITEKSPYGFTLRNGVAATINSTTGSGQSIGTRNADVNWTTPMLAMSRASDADTHPLNGPGRRWEAVSCERLSAERHLAGHPVSSSITRQSAIDSRLKNP